MKNSIRMVAAGFAALVFLTQAGIANAAEIEVLSVHGMRAVMEDLGPKFERTTGYKLAMTFATLGASGIHFAKVLNRLGIADEMKPKTVFLPKAGPVGFLVANGEAEIVVQPFQLLIPIAGIEIVGPLPGDLQDTLVFAAAIMGGTKDGAASKALVNFLRTPEAAKVIKAKGMEAETP